MNEQINAFLAEANLARAHAGTDENQLKQLLTEGMSWILQSQSQRLFQLLYRLDVPESKAEAVFRDFPQSDWPAELAGLVLEREKERQYWRQQYQNNPDSALSRDDQPEKGS